MSANDTYAVPPHPEPDRVDPTGTLIADVVCRRCGYNLRGLNEHGRCPECGTPVGLSTYGDLLRYADPDWVEKLAQGMSIILCGIVLGFVGGCLGGLAGTGAGTVFQRLIATGAQLVAVIGAWILTTPDPSGIGEDRYGNARRVVRFGFIFGVCGQLLWVMQGLWVVQGTISRTAMVQLVILATIFGLIAAVGTYALYLYIEKLAERVPDRKLAIRAKFIRWGYSMAIGGIAVIGGIAALWYLGSPPAAGVASGSGGMVVMVNRGATIIGAGVCFFGLAMLVFSILCIILYIRAMKVFRQQAQLARRTWASATHGRPAASPIPFQPPPQTPPDPPA